MEAESRRKAEDKMIRRQLQRPVAPCGLSFANLLQCSHKHTQAHYLLLCLPVERLVRFPSELDMSASFYLWLIDSTPRFPETTDHETWTQ